MDEIEFVKEQLNLGNYDILPDSIAIKKVFKIKAFGSLENDGYAV